MKFTDGRSSYKVNKHGTEEKVASLATSSDAVALLQYDVPRSSEGYAGELCAKKSEEFPAVFHVVEYRFVKLQRTGITIGNGPEPRCAFSCRYPPPEP